MAKTSKTKPKALPSAQEQEWDTVPAKPVPTDITSWEQEEQPVPNQLAVVQEEWAAIPFREAELTAEDWDAVPVPLTLNITVHSGEFDTKTTKIMIYGETGTQKTRTAATFPNAILTHGCAFTPFVTPFPTYGTGRRRR